MDPQLKENVICPASDAEMERRWKLIRELMKKEHVDFLIIQNSNDYVGGYVKWFTDMPAVVGYPVSVIFPKDGQMTTFWQGQDDPARASPPAWLLRGVKKRISAPIILSMRYTCDYHAEKVVQELETYKNCRIAFVNEGQMYTAFTSYIRQHLTGVQFVDITDRVDEIKAVKSAEEIDRIRAAAIMNDEVMKACIEAVKPGVREYEVMNEGRHRARMLGSEQQGPLMG